MPTQVHPGNTGNTLVRECSESSRDAYMDARSSSSYIAPTANRWNFDPRNGAALRAPFEFYMPTTQWNFSLYTGLAWTSSQRQPASIHNQYAPPVAVSAPSQVISINATTPLSQTNALMTTPATSTVEPTPAPAVATRPPAARRRSSPRVPAPVTDTLSSLTGPLTPSVALRHPVPPPVASIPAALMFSSDSSPAAYNPFSTHRSRRRHRSLPRRLRPASS